MRGCTSAAGSLERLEAEDLARARWYGFFSRWFLAPPDRQAVDFFLPASGGAIPGADALSSRLHPSQDPAAHEPPPTGGTSRARTPDSWLQSAWEAFIAAVAQESLEGIRAAYDDTFISVGEAPVSLHASVYLSGFANERPLAEVRQWLAEQGIQGSREGLHTEDHLGLLCEAMAWLIIGQGEDDTAADRAAAADASQQSDASQQYLFQRFIAPVCDELCQRLSEAPGAGIYRELGHLFAAFCAVERQAFEIER